MFVHLRMSDFLRYPDRPPLIPRHPARLCSGPTHPTVIVCSRPGAVPFVQFMEIPIPWQYILSHREYVFLKHHLCGGMELHSVSFRRSRILGDERWITHCHCNDPTSLQCLASRTYIYQLLKEFMLGTDFNSKWMFYRERVNIGMPECLLYIGSVYFRDLHLVYIRFSGSVEDCMGLRYTQVGGIQCVYCNADYGDFYVLICKSCKNRSEGNAYVCCRYTIKWMKAALNLMKSTNLTPSGKEEERCKQYRRFFEYNIPVIKAFGFL
ncbi:E4 34K [Bottlenose dolphin adenovirus 1]|uniref:E4 34K n=1 Tax=Bottlenose dolphin adenovirus 1 TaxID=1714377 RepID=A0A1X7MP02_9ADEN|nr:E4 34K [Bottlenose dolphin adenovirus 1]SMG83460.1 E4 34K [Bottlenose dolphin adenovirus 1]